MLINSPFHKTFYSYLFLHAPETSQALDKDDLTTSKIHLYSLLLFVKMVNLKEVVDFVLERQRSFSLSNENSEKLFGAVAVITVIGGLSLAQYQNIKGKKESRYVAIVNSTSFIIDVVIAVSGIAQIYFGYTASGTLTIGVFAIQLLHRVEKIKRWHYLMAHACLGALAAQRGWVAQNNIDMYGAAALTIYAVFSAGRAYQSR